MVVTKSERMRKCSRKWYVKNRSYILNRRKLIIDSWRDYFPKKILCECCKSKIIYFASGNINNSIHFDHRNEGKETIVINPMSWLLWHKRTKAYEKIWESNNFGMLCKDCNTRIPTLNRNKWIKYTTAYIKRKKK